MIHLDSLLFEFLKYNTVTCFFVLGILKGLALLTKSTVDDKIVTMLQNAISSIIPKRKEVKDGKVVN
jgi:hypothetical protein